MEEKSDSKTKKRLRPSPSLEKEQEVMKVVEKGYTEITRLIFATRPAIDRLLGYRSRIQNRRMKVKDLIRIDSRSPFEQLEEERKKILDCMDYVRQKRDEMLKLEMNRGYRDAWIKRRRRMVKKRVGELKLQYYLIDGILDVLTLILSKARQYRQKSQEDLRRQGLKTIERKVGMTVKNFEKMLEETSRWKEKIEKARQVLIEANEQRVIEMAKRHEGKGIPFDNLVQEGRKGLIKAASKLYFRERRFSFYAHRCIRQAIVGTINERIRNERTAKDIEEKYGKLIFRVIKAKDTLAKEESREPTDKEIAEFLRISEGSVKKVWQAISSLTSRERKVLGLRCGLGGGEPKTQEEVGLIFDVTRERIRQIEKRALKKLKYEMQRKRLEPLIELLE